MDVLECPSDGSSSAALTSAEAHVVNVLFQSLMFFTFWLCSTLNFENREGVVLFLGMSMPLGSSLFLTFLPCVMNYFERKRFLNPANLCQPFDFCRIEWTGRKRAVTFV